MPPAGALGALLLWGGSPGLESRSLCPGAPARPLSAASQQHRPSAAASPVPEALVEPFSRPLDPASRVVSPRLCPPETPRPASFLPQHPCVSPRRPASPFCPHARLQHTQGLCPTPGEVVGGQTRRESLMVGPSMEGQLMLGKPDLPETLKAECGGGGRRACGLPWPSDSQRGVALESVLSPVTFRHLCGVLAEGLRTCHG